MHICGPQSQLPGAGFEFDAVSARAAGVVGFDELVRDGLGAVGGAVVDDYEFPVEIAVGLWLS